MALEGCYSCIKYLMFAFNFLFWILGCVILGIGIWIKVDPNSVKDIAKDDVAVQRFFEEIDQYNQESVGAYVLITIGSIIMVIGFLGCCGAIRESQCMLVLFFIFLSIIFVALLACGIYIIMVKDKLKANISMQLKNKIKQGKEGDSAAKTFMKLIQDKFECCGADVGQSDYGSLNFVETQCRLENVLKPCTGKVYSQWSQNSVIIGGVAVGIAAVMFLGMIFSMLLCCAIKETMA